MGKSGAKIDPYAKRPRETHLEWRSRIAALDLAQRDRTEPIVPDEAQGHGDYRDEFVYHHESGCKTQTKRNHGKLLERWFNEGGIGFDKGAQAAVERCTALWELRPTIGNLCARYGPQAPSGGFQGYEGEMDLRDELDEFKSWFPPAYWSIYENVVRWGQPAGAVGSEMADNPPQAIASAKAVVGMVASFIAMRQGY